MSRSTWSARSSSSCARIRLGRLPIIGGLVVGVVLPAQAPPPPQPQPPTFRVEANFVRVDVYPTQNEQPVTDLRQEDFEVLEDGALQRVERFEHVVVRAAGPQTERIEPNTAREGDAMAADPRSRVFVLFLDTYHVSNEGSHRIRGPLVRLLDRVIGQDDLVGVMTPEMSAADLTFARRTITIEGMLTRHWTWGRREEIASRDPEEERYEACYPRHDQDFRGIAQEMIARRREKRSLDALVDLVVHLRGIREERKAILTISDGWRLFRQNNALARKLERQPIPGTPEIFVGPTGKITTRPEDSRGYATLYECDSDRLHLAQLDNERLFRDILELANRANASFYPVDPRGLPVFDTSIGPDPPLPPVADHAQLRGRQESLRTLAAATDGLAVVNSNDLDAGLRRIVDDLTSYYLLGYYSTNSKLDGKFRAITVRIKRPGIHVRARRGYRAATPEEVAAGFAASAAPVTEVPSAVTTALAALGGIRPETRFHLRATPGWPRDGQPGEQTKSGGLRHAIWVVGELDSTFTRSEEWAVGGEADITVTTVDGKAVGSTRARIAAGGRSFIASLQTDRPLDPGDYRVRVYVRSASGGTGLPVADVTQISVAPEAGAEVAAIGRPLWFRRGPSTGTRFEPTADPRFRRNERVRLEAPVRGEIGAIEGTLFDRRGQRMQIPIVTSERRDATDGSRWIVGEIALAPLAPGDYLVEIGVAARDRSRKVMTGLRVVP